MVAEDLWNQIVYTYFQIGAMSCASQVTLIPDTGGRYRAKKGPSAVQDLIVGVRAGAEYEVQEGRHRRVLSPNYRRSARLLLEINDETQQSLLR
ncbi:MAG: hypothetical protein ACRECH_05795 [Nitrososphaerales archaeon]